MRYITPAIALLWLACFSQASELDLVTGVCPPVRSAPQSYPPILRDLYSRVEDPDYWRLKDKSDLVSWVHELNHGASFQSCTPDKKHGVYLLGGRAIILTNPKVTIEQVARAVPRRDRGAIFSHYLVTQRRDWNSQPLYLLDEWTAYVHGAIAHDQLGLGEERAETFAFAWEMERYCRTMTVVIEKLDPTYPELNRLRSFIDWNSNRMPEKISGPSID